MTAAQHRTSAQATHAMMIRHQEIARLTSYLTEARKVHALVLAGRIPGIDPSSAPHFADVVAQTEAKLAEVVA
jgi:hypothetical protein